MSSPRKYVLTIEECQALANTAAADLMNRLPKLTKELAIFAVPRGGLAASGLIASAFQAMCANLNIKARFKWTRDPSLADVIVDDLVDSGNTRARYRALAPFAPFIALLDKTDEDLEEHYRHSWLVFPWEVSEERGDESATDIVTRLLEFIGEDPHREGLRDTPARFLKAWSEWASGYKVDPASVLKTFTDGAEDADEMVIVHNIPIVSKCEHHLADITGYAHVGYIPNGRIIGLSKIPRLVEIYSRRLQVQERLTGQIAKALWTHLEPLGVAVTITAAHGCMSTRGVKIHGSVTTTAKMLGAFRDKPEARHEFLNRCDAAERVR